MGYRGLGHCLSMSVVVWPMFGPKIMHECESDGKPEKFFFTSISESNSRELIEGVDELKKEILENKSNYEKRIEKHKKDIFIIQRELDSLKNKKSA